jgi:hypothetical protein
VKYLRVAAAVALAALLAIVIPVSHRTINRSKQKRTMHEMRLAAERFEKGGTIGAPRDAWDHPMRVRVSGRHYSIRAAARDGRFETGEPAGPVGSDDYNRDIVFVDGTYRQVPEGI